jgi:hypothetical protein
MKKTLKSMYRKRGSVFGAGGCGSPFMTLDPKTGKCVRKSLLESAKSVSKKTSGAVKSMLKKRGSKFGAGGCGSPFMKRDPKTGKCVRKKLLGSAKSVLKNTGYVVGAGTLALLSFGRRRRVCRKTSSVVNNFKCAAKKCKGTSNYRKCMKTTLRSIYRKRRPVKQCKSATRRKAPMCSATRLKIGATRKGLDGNRWVVRKSKNGVKRWVKK